MRGLLGLFFLVLSGTTVANEEPHYYWGFAHNQLVDGKSSKVIVLGARRHDTSANKIIDTQLYVSPNEGYSEYRYEFDFKNGKMTAFTKVKGKEKSVGEGTFKCDGDLANHKQCEYDYTEKGSYSGKGKDFMNVPGIYYREESDIKYESRPDVVKYSFEANLIDAKFYQELRKKLLR